MWDSFGNEKYHIDAVILREVIHQIRSGNRFSKTEGLFIWLYFGVKLANLRTTVKFKLFFFLYCIADDVIDLLDELLFLEECVLVLVPEDELVAIGKIDLYCTIYHQLCFLQLLQSLFVIFVHLHYDKMGSVFLQTVKEGCKVKDWRDFIGTTLLGVDLFQFLSKVGYRGYYVYVNLRSLIHFFDLFYQLLVDLLIGRKLWKIYWGYFAFEGRLNVIGKENQMFVRLLVYLGGL